MRQFSTLTRTDHLKGTFLNTSKKPARLSLWEIFERAARIIATVYYTVAICHHLAAAPVTPRHENATPEPPQFPSIVRHLDSKTSPAFGRAISSHGARPGLITE